MRKAGEGGLVRALGIEYGHDVANEIQRCDNDGDDTDGPSQRCTERNEEEDETRKEKGQRSVHDDGEETNNHAHAPFLQAHKAVLADVATRAGCSRWKRGVVVQPLLDQHGGESYDEARSETHGPKSVDPNGDTIGRE